MHLSKLDRIAKQLATVESVGEAVDLRNKASALQTYYRTQKTCQDIARQATVIRLRAERRIGELLAKTVKAGNPQLSSNTTIGIPQGITRDQSSRYQRIASLPAKIFDQYLEKSKQLSTGALVQLAKEQSLKTQRHGPKTGHNVITGDISTLADHLDDDSVSLVFTDPPYEKDSLSLFDDLARLAAAKLVRGGICATYCGTIYLPEVMEAMGAHLRYWWLFAVRCTGKTRLIHSRNVKQCYQTLVAYCRPPIKPRQPLIDLLQGGGQEKDYHRWQKPVGEAEYFIQRLTEPGDLVVDPFAGSGTTLLSAKNLNREFIGCDVDSGTARMARRRLAA